MATAADCYTCAQNTAAELPLWERIAADEHWRVAHSFNSALPGWLVLMPRRHVVAVAELTDAEAASLGSWQVRLSRALARVVGCQKTYVAQFAEGEGFAHVHFHVVPRPPDLPAELRGPRVFGLLNPDDRPHVSAEQRDRIAADLISHLG